MKKIVLLLAILFNAVTGWSQDVDNFRVGPYSVDYRGDGDVKYRLLDIDLYEFYGLTKDTIRIEKKEKPLSSGIQISGFVETSYINSPKGLGIEGLWKQALIGNVYVNAGLSADFMMNTFSDHRLHRYMLEAGIPLQVEYGKLCHESSSLYGSIGVTPAFYTTLKAERWRTEPGNQGVTYGVKKSGFLVTPTVEFGGNIPVGNMIMRIGLFARYKFNCSKGGEVDIYHTEVGRAFLGAKIGFVL